MMNVLLLREPSDVGPDSYETTFKAAGYNPVSLPVLETVYENLPLLTQVISKGPVERRVSGVVITSKRSCEAWGDAQTGVALDQLERWTRVPFYVVGEGTAHALQEAFRGDGSHTLTLDIRGQKSGNAAVLAPFILDDVKQRPAKLLYLSGDKNRDTIPRLLDQGGVELDTIHVYRTQGSTSLGQMLAERVAEHSKDKEPWWIACFAPSSTLITFPFLQQHFNFEQNSPAEKERKGGYPARMAAIGPTTKSCLESDLAVRVDVTAEQPTAEGLLSVIQTFQDDA